MEARMLSKRFHGTSPFYVVLNLFQHRKNERLCDPELNSGRRDLKDCGCAMTFRSAAITVEITLSLALSLLVLFLSLGLVFNNFKSMADSGGMHNMFNKDNAVAKTFTNTAKDKRYDPTQVTVQVVADQGLTDYMANAQATIDMYKNKTTLTPEEASKLAQALTIDAIGKGNAGTSNPNTSVATGHGILINFNGIDASGNQVGVTTVGGKTTSYDSPYNTDGSDNSKLTLAKDVSSKTF